ncbi:hypothetical protein MRX96_035267 [Rhipicephalus microplus]
MHSTKCEHAKLTKNQSEYEIKVHKLKQELVGMKKYKVALATKKKKENRCHQEAEKPRNWPIAQILKVSCQQGNRIRSLDAQNSTKELVLKLCYEEMAVLCRQIFSAS